ncbi:MAG: FAD-binding oxidoreductase [Limibacillus sp.]
MTRNIIIVGGGIVGAALAYRLAVDGAQTLLLEEGEPAGGVTGKAFAWINASGVGAGPGEGAGEGPWGRLRREAIPAWRDVQREVGTALAIDWCGALTWQNDPEATAAKAEALKGAGQAVSLLDRRAIAQLEPGLAAPPSTAVYAAEEGALAPLAVTQGLVAAAAEKGAVIRTGQRVEALRTKGGRVTGVQLQQGWLEADSVVLAAGLGSVRLCAELGLDLPLEASPSMWLSFDVARPLLRGIVSGPDFEARQAGARQLLAAEDFVDSERETGPAAIAARAEKALIRGLKRSDGLALSGFAIGQRPMPRDGLPILGGLPGIEGLFLAAMHSGITLAPLAARILAAEIMEGHPLELAQPFRPSRFAE